MQYILIMVSVFPSSSQVLPIFPPTQLHAASFFLSLENKAGKQAQNT